VENLQSCGLIRVNESRSYALFKVRAITRRYVLEIRNKIPRRKVTVFKSGGHLARSQVDFGLGETKEMYRVILPQRYRMLGIIDFRCREILRSFTLFMPLCAFFTCVFIISRISRFSLTRTYTVKKNTQDYYSRARARVCMCSRVIGSYDVVR